ncbi:unnamed protein product [Amoebophrya sp. A120]|nr:unnamed protein product [Amoebophrya sp. A120]|eukprot:GSA120T00017215001.1
MPNPSSTKPKRNKSFTAAANMSEQPKKEEKRHASLRNEQQLSQHLVAEKNQQGNDGIPQAVGRAPTLHSQRSESSSTRTSGSFPASAIAGPGSGENSKKEEPSGPPTSTARAGSTVRSRNCSSRQDETALHKTSTRVGVESGRQGRADNAKGSAVRGAGAPRPASSEADALLGKTEVDHHDTNEGSLFHDQQEHDHNSVAKMVEILEQQLQCGPHAVERPRASRSSEDAPVPVGDVDKLRHDVPPQFAASKVLEYERQTSELDEEVEEEEGIPSEPIRALVTVVSAAPDGEQDEEEEVEQDEPHESPCSSVSVTSPDENDDTEPNPKPTLVRLHDRRRKSDLFGDNDDPQRRPKKRTLEELAEPCFAFVTERLYPFLERVLLKKGKMIPQVGGEDGVEGCILLGEEINKTRGGRRGRRGKRRYSAKSGITK